MGLRMLVDEMITRLVELRDQMGNVEVLITDGYDARGYRGTFSINEFSHCGSFIDIGIGGCEEDDSE